MCNVTKTPPYARKKEGRFFDMSSARSRNVSMDTRKSIISDSKTKCLEETTVDNASRTVQTLIDIYDKNPGLQRIRNIKKQPQQRKLENRGTLKEKKRKVLRAPIHHYDTVPLPSKSKTLLKRKLGPRNTNKKTLKSEEVPLGNTDDMIKAFKEKCDLPKLLGRYKKSEFDVFSKLDTMKITDSTNEDHGSVLSTNNINGIEEETRQFVSSLEEPSLKVVATECDPEELKVCLRYIYVFQFLKQSLANIVSTSMQTLLSKHHLPEKSIFQNLTFLKDLKKNMTMSPFCIP